MVDPSHGHIIQYKTLRGPAVKVCGQSYIAPALNMSCLQHLWCGFQGGNIGVTPFISILRELLTDMEIHRCSNCGQVSVV